MAEIEARFNEENAHFIALTQHPRDVIGRLLKCHLIVEHYLEQYLSEQYGLENVADAKLNFFNKAMLLPTRASSAAFVRPGILKLNTIRNKAGHNLGAEPDFADLGPIVEALRVARPHTMFTAPIEAIEAFATIACTWLVIPPKEHQQLFAEAFSNIRVHAG
ncbi:hypothetical protein [Rhodanobacter aciditrophus]|uniref:hypothetical protein n=1 Tax=Rhodanobacter aciditrophus TaxID=1623218 RepID=UPI003CFA3B1A